MVSFFTSFPFPLLNECDKGKYRSQNHNIIHFDFITYIVTIHDTEMTNKDCPPTPAQKLSEQVSSALWNSLDYTEGTLNGQVKSGKFVWRIELPIKNL